MSSEESRIVVFIADYFYEQGIRGGAEVCNKNLIEQLIELYGWQVKKITSSSVDVDFLNQNKDHIFIIANFMLLKKDIINFLSSNAEYKYIIYEHDHKYVSTNDPSKFPNMVIPSDLIINREFYERAFCVLAQSKLHAEIMEKNLLLDNIINLAGNIWSPEQIELLKANLLIAKEKLQQKESDDSYVSILQSSNKNKGMLNAVKICNQKGWNFDLIPPSEYSTFLNNLAKTNRLLFTPQWVETFSRVCVEAKILGCKIKTNNLVGCFSEDWVRNSSSIELLEQLKLNSDRIVKTFNQILRQEIDQDLFFSTKINTDKITVITSIYKGEKYIKNFLRNILKQTYINKTEFILAIAKSDTQDTEEQEIIEFIRNNKHVDIKYHKFNNLLSVQESMNFMIEKASGRIISIWNIDDARRNDSLERIAKFFALNQEAQVVYHDCLQTKKENELFEHNSSDGTLYEHSIGLFSSENMVKCLPGPMPSWKKEIHSKVGFFDTNLKFAGDWDFWLRCVRDGIRFYKIGPPMGLYYFNPSGLSTSNDSQNKINRFMEERKIFINNLDIFGPINYNRYKGYFNVE